MRPIRLEILANWLKRFQAIKSGQPDPGLLDTTSGTATVNTVPIILAPKTQGSDESKASGESETPGAETSEELLMQENLATLSGQKMGLHATTPAEPGNAAQYSKTQMMILRLRP